MLVYLLNGLANIAAANKGLSAFVGKHGACEAVVSVLEQRPRDLQLQAAGCKAIRALALFGGRNVNILAAQGGPEAIVRAQGLFLRDREVQLACLGAVETLCRGGSTANKTALVTAGSITLLETVVDQLADDTDVVVQALRALVELQSSSINASQAVGGSCSDKVVVAGRLERRDSDSVRHPVPSSLPILNPISGGADDSDGALMPPMSASKPAETSGVMTTDTFRAVGTVLAIMEHNPCREVCLSAFDALGRLLVVADQLGDALVSAIEPNFNSIVDDRYEAGASIPDTTKSGADGAVARGLLQWAKVGYAVKRALKLNQQDDSDLVSGGGKILALVAVARGRALAQ